MVRSFLAFLDTGSSGLSLTRTCWGTYSGVAFLLDVALLEKVFWVGSVTGTCLGACLAGAFPLAFVEELSGEETIFSTCSSSCYEGLGVSGDL